MRILTISSAGEQCGIATYNEALVQGFRTLGSDVENFRLFTASGDMTPQSRLLNHFDSLVPDIKSFDGVVIQHEYGLFGGCYSVGFAQKVFHRLLKIIEKSGRPAAIIFHTDPVISSRFLSSKRIYWERIRKIINRNSNMAVYVHGPEAYGRYRGAGIDQKSLRDIIHPFPAVRQHEKRPKDDDVILTIFGFVARYKGHREALEALKLLPERFKLIVAGGRHPGLTAEDSTYEEIVAAQDGELKGRLEVTGWLDDEQVQDVMARSDIVLAPYHENGPSGSGAITWAMCNARPVVASDTRTFRYIQEKAGSFLVVPPEDSAALADAILKLESDPDLAKQLSANAADFAGKHGWDAMAQEIAGNFARQARSGS